MTHVYRWGKYLPDRKGQRCRVLARSRLFPRIPNKKRRGMGSILLEFEDGFKIVTSRYAVRKATP